MYSPVYLLYMFSLLDINYTEKPLFKLNVLICLFNKTGEM